MTSTEEQKDSSMGLESVIEIKNASLKDMQCSYGYELLTGKTKGDTINRKGIHIIHEDLESSFNKLVVFVAHIDGVFSHWANNQTPLTELEAREELEKYSVYGFQLTGAEENKSVIFKGSKETPYGSMSIDTPKIKLNGGYLYLDEAQIRLNDAIAEVEEYMNGKTAPQFEQEEIEFEEEEDFERSKV